jgi:hypothetical protein
MKLRFRVILSLAAFLFAGTPLLAQNHVAEAMRRAEREYNDRAAARNPAPSRPGGRMPYTVENGDTTYLDVLEPTWIFARGKASREKDWRKYYRLVYNFPRVYPYALAAARIEAAADSTVAARKMNRTQRERYVNEVQKQLFKDFEPVFRKMTYTQGALLVRLIDRETSKTSYSIIKEYKGGLTAGFWQGIARLFDGDLKASYDPEGADRDTEELVQLWEQGRFSALYFSIFWEDAPEVVLPPRYR